MAKIAFILLCHKDPQAIIHQAEMLTAADDFVSIHFDARAKPEHYAALRDALDDNPNVVFAHKRIKCGWGEWSLVDASLQAVEAAVAAFPRATHFYMVSGDCMPIKSAKYAHAFLDRDDCDYVESFDFFDSGWIKTGIKEERLIYRHYLNERNHKSWFYRLMNWQKKLGMERAIPHDLQIMIGSQWWCLRRGTIDAILEFTRKRKDVMDFFSTTWIPDETFFQTLVRHLVPGAEIRSRTLTFLIFTDYGMPAVFYNDHYDLLMGQDYLFARKISPEAYDLKEKLGSLYIQDEATFKISNEGRNLHGFLTKRGRVGRRFASRFWETESSLGRERELMVVVCKKWHVAKRLLEQIRQHTDILAIEYLFDEGSTPVPALGGIETSIAKRTRHRRALVRMLFDYYETDRMILCLDPSRLELMHDFNNDRSKTRILEVECDFTDDYLIGHAKRVGLAGEQTTDDTMGRLLPTIRQDMQLEIDHIRDADFDQFYRVRESRSRDENAEQLAGFLNINNAAAKKILDIDYLFSD